MVDWTKPLIQNPKAGLQYEMTDIRVVATDLPGTLPIAIHFQSRGYETNGILARLRPDGRMVEHGHPWVLNAPGFEEKYPALYPALRNLPTPLNFVKMIKESTDPVEGTMILRLNWAYQQKLHNGMGAVGAGIAGFRELAQIDQGVWREFWNEIYYKAQIA